MEMLILLGLMVLMMAFTFRGQKKQQEQRLAMLNAMKPGDKVVTIGGLYGVIDSIDTEVNTVVLDIEGIYLTFERAAIRTVVSGDSTAPAIETATEEEKSDSAIEE